jgi:hypothetical protein
MAINKTRLIEKQRLNRSYLSIFLPVNAQVIVIIFTQFVFRKPAEGFNKKPMQVTRACY